MSMKPICLCSTFNFELQDNHGNPGSVGIVFLYKPRTNNMNFCLCESVFRKEASYYIPSPFAKILLKLWWAVIATIHGCRLL